MARPKARHARQVKSGRRQFAVVLTPEKGGWYSVTCPALPGCHSQGKGITQALANIREAIELVLEDASSHNDALPAGDALLATVQV
jgi:antitoxin HicB